MKSLEDHPVADHVLDVVGGRAEEHEKEVATVVAVLKRPELRARRGARGGERRSTHRDDYNPGSARRRPSRGWGPAGRGALTKASRAAGRRGGGAPPAEARVRRLSAPAA